MLELTVRLIVSLAIVVGLLLVLARFGARKFKGNSGALVHVVHRQALSRTSSVSVVTVGTRVLVLGTTEQQISVLAELDPEELELELDDVAELADVSFLQPPLLDVPAAPAALDPPRAARTPGSHRAGPATKSSASVPSAATGALAGSVLSLQTWRQAINAARRAS
ncbi:MAG: flagellar biosynthetic protein FliO [Propionibacteriales bacterium]|nr:flagellar biosynthetic protein FliO [Propionibacteriales bacterium]